jgi:hypothetical protein
MAVFEEDPFSRGIAARLIVNDVSNLGRWLEATQLSR